MSRKIVFAIFVMAVILLNMEMILGARRKCETDCDCRVTRGQRCVFRVRRTREIVHCSRRPVDMGGYCRCRKGCMSIEGTFVRNKKTFTQGCLNMTCTKASTNTLTMAGNLC